MKLSLIGIHRNSLSMAYTLQELTKSIPNPPITICGIYNGNADTAVNAAISLKCKVYLSLKDLFNESDIIFMGVDDRKLPQFAEVLKNSEVKGKILCHFSEKYNSDILLCGTANTYASFYIPYARKTSKLQNLSDGYIMVEGFGRDFKKFSNTLKNLHDAFVICTEADKALAVLAKRFEIDYVTELLSAAVQLYKFVGIYSPQKFYEHFIRTIMGNNSFKEGNICEYLKSRPPLSSEESVRKSFSLLNKINYSDLKSIYRMFETNIIKNGRYTDEEKENLTLLLKRLR